MVRRLLAALSLAVLLSTAGCTGVLETDAAPDRDPYSVPPPSPTETATPTESTPEERIATSTPLASREYLDRIENHSQRISRRGNVTVRLRSETVENNVTTISRYTLEIDLAADRAWIFGRESGREAGGFDTEQWFLANGTLYRNFSVRTGQRRYTVRNQSSPQAEAFQQIIHRIPRERIVERTSGLPLERNGTVTVDGRRMLRYTTTDPGGLSAELGVTNVSSFRATVLVDEHGTVRRFEYAISGTDTDGEPYDARRTYVVEGIGTTTVDRPDWTDRAVPREELSPGPTSTRTPTANETGDRNGSTTATTTDREETSTDGSR